PRSGVTRRFFRALLLAIAWLPILLSGQVPASSVCAINGAITASGFPLPGVVVAAKADGQSLDVSSSLPDGSYLLKIPGPGHYTVSADLVAFAPLVREVEVDASSCSPRIDLVMTLASRAQAASETGTPSSRSLGSRPIAGGASAAAQRSAGGGRGDAQHKQ